MKENKKTNRSFDASELKEISNDVYSYFLAELAKKEKRKALFMKKISQLTDGRRIVLTNSAK